jgi:hypothetical protein
MSKFNVGDRVNRENLGNTIGIVKEILNFNTYNVKWECMDNMCSNFRENLTLYVPEYIIITKEPKIGLGVWYNGKIGETFKVIDIHEGDNAYEVYIEGDSPYFVQASHCEPYDKVQASDCRSCDDCAYDFKAKFESFELNFVAQITSRKVLEKFKLFSENRLGNIDTLSIESMFRTQIKNELSKRGEN